MARVMGVVNVTPDSFSDGGLFLDPERAIGHGRELAAAGAAILDIGGESTRPGAEAVPAAEEVARTEPVVRALCGPDGPGIEVSIDVEFTVEVVKGKEIRWPRAEDEEFVMAVGNARPLDQAAQHATTELMRLLADDHGLDHRASSVLLGQCIRYDVGNVFDPAYTMVAKVAKSVLP